MKNSDVYVKRISNHYNHVHAAEFGRHHAEKKFLEPFGLSLKKKKQINSQLGDNRDKLSRKEEFQLFAALHFMKFKLKKCVSKDLEYYLDLYIILRNRGVSSNWLLFISCMKKCRSQFLEVPYNHKGYCTLISAVDAFDPWRGWKFSTYAGTAIMRGFLGNKNSISSVNLKDYSYIPQPSNNDSDQELYIERLKHFLSSDILTLREKSILAYRFGCFDYNKQLRLSDVGPKFNLCKERIRQIQKGAIKKLKNALKKDPIIQ